jgi:uncharacterized membrane protein
VNGEEDEGWWKVEEEVCFPEENLEYIS